MKYLLWCWFWGSFCTWHASWDVVAYAEMQSLSFIKRKRNFSRSVLSARSLFVKWSTGPSVYYIPSWRIKKYSRPISNDIVELYNSKQARKTWSMYFCLYETDVLSAGNIVCWQYWSMWLFGNGFRNSGLILTRNLKLKCEKYLWPLLMISSIHNTAQSFRETWLSEQS